MRVRGRFDIVVPFGDGGAYIRITSDKTRSLRAGEIVERLREYIGYIDRGARAEAKQKARKRR